MEWKGERSARAAHDVLGFEVAMRHILAVAVVDGRQHLYHGKDERQEEQGRGRGRG